MASYYSNTRPSYAYSGPPQLSTEEFRQKLNHALGAYYPNQYTRTHYNSVKVLFVRWDIPGSTLQDTLRREMRALSDVFEKGYNYQTELFLISAKAKNPAYDLIIEIQEWAKGCTERDLLIFYYGGHGCFRNGLNNRTPCEFCSGSWAEYDDCYADGRTFRRYADPIDFHQMKSVLLDIAPADVLYLLESCHAGDAATSPGKELLAACDIHTTGTSAGSGHRTCTFTKALIRELNNASSSRSYLTVAQLYGLLAECRWKVAERKPDGTPITQLDRMPVHAQLHAQARTSIYLVPHMNQSASAATGPNAMPVHNPRIFFIPGYPYGNNFGRQ